ncbi:cytochrome P450-dit2 [Apophysomyces sp. BC1021]|nr:cytochrome P450-dit2 [Apophysomyces sp. BC1021]
MPCGWIVFSANPEANKAILTNPDLYYKTKDIFGDPDSLVVKLIGGDHIGTLDGPDWKRHRKIAAPPFQKPPPVQTFGQVTLKMLDILDRSEGTPVTVNTLTERVTLDIIGLAGFGSNFESIKNDDSPLASTYNDIKGCLINPLFIFFQKLDTHYRWLFPKRVKAHQALEKFRGLVDELVEKRRKDILVKNNDADGSEKDLLSLMLEAEMEGDEKMTNEELRDIQQRAREEALSILGTEPADILPTADHIKRMTYLLHVIKEALRLDGPTVNTMGRITKQDSIIAGQHVPADTFIMLDVLTTHRDSNIWENADQFDPDRYSVETETARNSSANGLVWTPFGYGPHQCLGLQFSLAEQRVIMSMLLRKYEWELADKSSKDKDLRSNGFVIITPYEFKVIFKRRY